MQVLLNDGKTYKFLSASKFPIILKPTINQMKLSRMCYRKHSFETKADLWKNRPIGFMFIKLSGNRQKNDGGGVFSAEKLISAPTR